MLYRHGIPASAVGRQGKLYAIGGDNSGQDYFLALPYTEAYSPRLNAWVTKASLPYPVEGAGATLGTDGLIYVFGGATCIDPTYPPGMCVVGESPQWWATQSVYAYDPAGDVWLTSAHSLTAPRVFAAAVTAPDGSIYVIGGDTAGAPTMELWKGGGTQRTYTLPGPPGGGVFDGHISATLNPQGTEIWAALTLKNAPPASTIYIYKYTLATGKWTRMPSLPTPAGASQTYFEWPVLTAANGRIYAFGSIVLSKGVAVYSITP